MPARSSTRPGSPVFFPQNNGCLLRVAFASLRHQEGRWVALDASREASGSGLAPPRGFPFPTRDPQGLPVGQAICSCTEHLGTGSNWAAC